MYIIIVFIIVFFLMHLKAIKIFKFLFHCQMISDEIELELLVFIYTII